MRVKDLIERLIEIERDYGNLRINRFIDIEIQDDSIIITERREE